ncbi:MAG: dTDP-4-dehydrorhamnose 3,5-epimerase [Stellaceae bacterium]
MIFTPARLPGLCLVAPERHEDERGWFARSWCAREFAAHGLDARPAQTSLSFNRRQGTLRGLHYQLPPYAEAKLVRCVRGAIWDVALDLRPHSATRGQWQAFELSAENGCALYLPEGFAHGFQTLLAESEVLYQISSFHAPEAAAGVRYDDPAFAIAWPLPVASISPRDAAWPDYPLAADSISA